MPNYDFYCEPCKGGWENVTSYEERDVLQQCPHCKEMTGERVFINFPGVTRASYVDGVKRTGFADLKEAAKLEVQMMNLPVEKRKEVKKEIHKLSKIKK